MLLLRFGVGKGMCISCMYASHWIGTCYEI
jgi:hypothetical protein